MKILITGGCGFVGSNLAIYLKKRLKNSKISSLDNLFRNGSMNEIEKTWCISKLTANGLSWSKLILKPGTNKEDPNKSRRVEFRVKIDAEKKLRDLSNMMEDTKASN